MKRKMKLQSPLEGVVTIAGACYPVKDHITWACLWRWHCTQNTSPCSSVQDRYEYLVHGE